MSNCSPSPGPNTPQVWAVALQPHPYLSSLLQVTELGDRGTPQATPTSPGQGQWTYLEAHSKPHPPPQVRASGPTQRHTPSHTHLPRLGPVDLPRGTLQATPTSPGQGQWTYLEAHPKPHPPPQVRASGPTFGVCPLLQRLLMIMVTSSVVVSWGLGLGGFYWTEPQILVAYQPSCLMSCELAQLVKQMNLILTN